MDKFYFQMEYPEFLIAEVVDCPVFGAYDPYNNHKYVFGFVIFDETVYPYTTYINLKGSEEQIVKYIYKAAIHAMLPEDYDNVTSFTEDKKHDELKLKLLDWAKKLKELN